MGIQIIELFGQSIEKWSEHDPALARRLLKAGWQAQGMKLKYLPNQALLPADRYLSQMMMNAMVKPLAEPEQSVIVSIFTPCELMQEVGLHPYSVEGFSCFLSGSQAERGFLQQAENSGISETLCSYHKAFLGAAQKGVLPKPRCIVYTNLTCDANLLTFRTLAELFDVPSFFIDVPMRQSEENVRYVEGQLRRLAAFLEEHTGIKIDEGLLAGRLSRSRRTLDNFERCQCRRSEKYVPADLTTPMYCAVTNNILLGTEEAERYTQMLLEDLETTGPSRGKRIYWMHTVPFWSEALKNELQLKETAQIVGCELAQVYDSELRFDPDKPYDAMARRLVYHSTNGNAGRRIDIGIRHAKQAGADGVVWLNHWGCKHTLGIAQMAKRKFEEHGIPLLILDSDGCDRSHGGEGQIATRLGAFLEMLGGRDDE